MTSPGSRSQRTQTHNMCPCHNFLLPKWNWIIYTQLLFIFQGQVIILTQDHIFICQNHSAQITLKFVLTSFHITAMLYMTNNLYNCCPYCKAVCYDLDQRSPLQGQRTNITKSLLGSKLVTSIIMLDLDDISHNCIKTLTQGHIPKIKVIVHTDQKFVSGPHPLMVRYQINGNLKC